ncbi:nuclear transport factor 2 family protein [Actinokineospora terrae]|uniref:SnoaL-like domain-containing protein n=1 Tax=Actinokineospora terrae TaxID=155974 RepID=A0A1H9LPF2_9PSEU|nr:nuclear transport factor 2 family protein [Actinokineospora terrae]SER13314.1 hypothetical protein SAMN04487818_101690 [Actinokineospora terrae]
MSTPVTTRDTATTIGEFFARFGAGDRPGMLELFAEGAELAVAGADTVPWTGVRTEAAAIDEFLRIALEDVSTEVFTVDKIIVDGRDGVVLGSLAHRITATDRVFASAFALHVQVVDGLITSYRMFEDSHAAEVSWTR